MTLLGAVAGVVPKSEANGTATLIEACKDFANVRGRPQTIAPPVENLPKERPCSTTTERLQDFSPRR